MHIADVVDIGDAAARRVAAPGAQHPLQALAMFGQAGLDPLQQEHRVGVVVAADEIGLAAMLHVVPGLLEQLVHGVAGHLVMGIGLAAAAAFAAAAVVEVRQVELLYIVFAHQRQQGRQLRVVVLGQGGAQANANAVPAAQVDGVHGRGEAALELAPVVVHRFQAVDADADVVVLRGGDLLDVLLVDQRAVGRQCNEEAALARVLGQFENVVAQQRFAAGKDQYADTGFVKIVDDLEGFGGVQLVAKYAVGGGGVAVLAGQVTAPQQVPDHHRRPCATGAACAQYRHGGPGEGTQVMADSQHERLSPRHASCVFRWRQHPRLAIANP